MLNRKRRHRRGELQRSVFHIHIPHSTFPICMTLILLSIPGLRERDLAMMPKLRELTRARRTSDSHAEFSLLSLARCKRT